MPDRNINKRLLFTSFLAIFIFSIFVATPILASTQLQTAQLQKTLGNTYIPFIKNQGQRHADVAFYAQALGGAVFVTQKGELVYSLPRETKQGTDGWAFKESFISSNDLTPMQKGTGQIFSSLSLGDIAPGIQVRLESKKNNIEKLFVLSAGADVANIKVALEGIEGSHLNKDGQLVLETGLGLVAFTKPIAFQMNGDKKEFVKVSYTLKNNQYGFSLGEYDHSKEIVIDPLLASTFVGGSGFGRTDIIRSVVTDGDFIYVGGITQSLDFPTALGYNSEVDTSYKGFVLRFNNDLSTLLNAAIIGTTVYAIKLDDDGTLVASGRSGRLFPISDGAYNIDYTPLDNNGYLARFSADLTTLISSSVVVDVLDITVLELGNNGIYFGGRTINPDLRVTENVFGPTCFCPIIGAYEFRETSNFIGRLSADFSTLEVLTYIPFVDLKQILVAPDSSLYVSGNTVTHYDADLTTPLATTTWNMGTRGIALGNDFLVGVGRTTSSNLPVSSGAYDSTCGTDGNCDKNGSNSTAFGADAFVVKYSLDLQNILALTYIGGSVSDELNHVAVDALGDIVATGNTFSNNSPTSSTAFDRTHNGNRDVIIVRFSSDLTRLSYSSYVGSSNDDNVHGLAIDLSGNVFIGGETLNGDFPTTTGAFSETYNGGPSDAFISKFDTLLGTADPAPGPAENIAPVANAGNDRTVPKRSLVYLDGRNSSDIDGNIVSYYWTQISGKSVKLKNVNSVTATFTSPSVKKGAIKTFEFELTVTDEQGASSSDRVIINVKS